jgi:hypothetical protein
MSWRLAKSLDLLRRQINAAYPHRRKDSDGTIGDANHASRTSDHNPWVDGNVVTAFDITHDPESGVDCTVLADRLIASRDHRIKYIIWNKRIANYQAMQGVVPFAWRPYHGASDHTEHLHLSVRSSAMFYDSVQPWAIPTPTLHDMEKVALNKHEECEAPGPSHEDGQPPSVA